MVEELSIPIYEVNNVEVKHGDEETNYVYFPKDQWREFMKAVIQFDERIDHESLAIIETP